ncbi:MAG: hypothetical protein AB8I52_07695 [Candidatus Promineifilaceae bacterium]|jgi:hypothetical protein
MKHFSKIFLLIILLTLVTASVAMAGNDGPTPDKIVVDKFTETSVGDLGGVSGIDFSGPTTLEIQKPKTVGPSPLRRDPAAGDVVPLAPGFGSPTSSAKKAKSNPELMLSFEGVNHRDSRLADNGNQYSGEPADQGVCAGNGYILETVNSALRIYDAESGDPVTPVLSLNEFYGFPPAIDRTDAPNYIYGPFTFDISCHYDPDSNRWFHLAVDLDQDPTTGAYTGKNYLDLAVSTSGDPTGDWNVYRIPGMNDGSEGTPDHGCAGGPCFADFPHIGADKNGVYITSNEFPLFGPGFNGAQVYAISKSSLAAGDDTIEAYLFDTSLPAWQAIEGQPGFTLWPALSAGKQFAGAQGGTEYFASSTAVFDDYNGDAEEIVVWALSNTKSLDMANPSLKLTSTVVPSLRYAVPPPSVQKDGTIPLGNLVGATEPGIIDTSDSRIMDTRYANGKLWAVLGTAVEVGGEQRAGVAWFILNPTVNNSGVSATMRSEGILALEGESLAYPTLGVTNSGRGVIGFTRVGENLHPSQGYASIDDVAGVGPVHMAAEGNAPQDGFTEYTYFSNRPRWGDYGAAAVDGRNVYLSGQYIEQGPCTEEEFLTTDCNYTRTFYANWSTRVFGTTP